MALTDRIKNAWNAFMSRSPTNYDYSYYNGYVSSMRPDRNFRSFIVDKTLLISIMNRMALDVSNIGVRHIITDEKGRYVKDAKSKLNRCFKLQPNLDQTPKTFFKDVVLSMFDEGNIAIVPVVTDKNPNTNEVFDIYELRVGKIVQWYPRHVRVSVYNENTGHREEITFLKDHVAIVENPFYEIMNEPNSTFKRLVRKLALLDAIDDKTGSGRLDMIIQLPFTIKTEARKQQAESRRQEIETQLAGSQYGIAYTDATERVIQLNRAVDNNLLSQITYLTNLLFSQLGLTESIMNGTADEATMLNYENRTLVPILSNITEAMKCKFLSDKALERGESIEFFRDPFKLVPVGTIAEFADKFTRNEIMSTNEIRQIVGLIPVQDPRADELRNKNLNPTDGQEFASAGSTEENSEENQNEAY